MKKIVMIISLGIFLIACSTNNNQNATKPECSLDSDCMKSGCSGQLCIPTEKKDGGFTTCEFKPEYECYQYQNCVCINNKCSWSNQEGLNKCIAEKSEITA